MRNIGSVFSNEAYFKKNCWPIDHGRFLLLTDRPAGRSTGQPVIIFPLATPYHLVANSRRISRVPPSGRSANYKLGAKIQILTQKCHERANFSEKIEKILRIMQFFALSFCAPISLCCVCWWRCCRPNKEETRLAI